MERDSLASDRPDQDKGRGSEISAQVTAEIRAESVDGSHVLIDAELAANEANRPSGNQPGDNSEPDWVLETKEIEVVLHGDADADASTVVGAADISERRESMGEVREGARPSDAADPSPKEDQGGEQQEQGQGQGQEQTLSIEAPQEEGEEEEGFISRAGEDREAFSPLRPSDRPGGAGSNSAVSASSSSGSISIQQSSPVAKPLSSSTNDHEATLKRFGLSAQQDKVLDSFSCALYPKKGLLTHGRMFITQHYVAFAGWKDMRVLLPMSRISRVEKTNTLKYIPNALSIVMEDKEEYFYGSFIDRDTCHSILQNLVEIERRIIEIHGGDLVKDSRALQFGYQTKAPSRLLSSAAGLSFQSLLMGHSSTNNSITNTQTNANSSINPNTSNSAVTNVMSRSASPMLPEASHELSLDTPSSPPRAISPMPNSVDHLNSNRNNSNSPVPETQAVNNQNVPSTPVPLPTPPSSPPQSVEKQNTNTNTNIVDSTWLEKLNSTSNNTSSGTSNNTASNSVPNMSHENNSAAISSKQSEEQFNSLVNKKSISWLLKKGFPDCSTEQMWRACWLSSAGYGDFLQSEGAEELKYSEWSPYANSNNSSTSNIVEEDVHLQLQYCYSRDFAYSFPRTTMLMFGPKLAPIKQSHYLFLPHSSHNNNGKTLETMPVHNAVILFVTKFDGIPMADVFKVLQYWVIKRNNDGTTHLEIGVAIHYVKSTMFKSQILSGTKEEVGMLLKKYEIYAANRAAKNQDVNKASILEHQQPSLPDLSIVMDKMTLDNLPSPHFSAENTRRRSLRLKASFEQYTNISSASYPALDALLDYLQENLLSVLIVLILLCLLWVFFFTLYLTHSRLQAVDKKLVLLDNEIKEILKLLKQR